MFTKQSRLSVFLPARGVAPASLKRWFRWYASWDWQLPFPISILLSCKRPLTPQGSQSIQRSIKEQKTFSMSWFGWRELLSGAGKICRRNITPAKRLGTAGRGQYLLIESEAETVNVWLSTSLIYSKCGAADRPGAEAGPG